MHPETLLGSPPIRIEQNWQERDSILYALGVGSEDLDFVYEEGLKALPTMAVVLGYPGFIWRNPKWNVDWKKVLHGEQSIIIHKPFPAKGQFIGETRTALQRRTHQAIPGTLALDGVVVVRDWRGGHRTGARRPGSRRWSRCSRCTSPPGSKGGPGPTLPRR